MAESDTENSIKKKNKPNFLSESENARLADDRQLLLSTSLNTGCGGLGRQPHRHDCFLQIFYPYPRMGKRGAPRKMALVAVSAGLQAPLIPPVSLLSSEEELSLEKEG